MSFLQRMAYCPPFCTICANQLVIAIVVSMKRSTQRDKFQCKILSDSLASPHIYPNIAPWNDAPVQWTALSAVRPPPGVATQLRPPHPAPPSSVSGYRPSKELSPEFRFKGLMTQGSQKNKTQDFFFPSQFPLPISNHFKSLAVSSISFYNS